MERSKLIAEALNARFGRQRPEGTTYVMVPSMLQDAVHDFLATGDVAAYEGDVEQNEGYVR